ncbi:hypothetical protein N9L26_02615 [Candidatus Pacebacteria bacterium]|nr:hypothetical protein [Candidatus Paceibacterota bacterium]
MQVGSVIEDESPLMDHSVSRACNPHDRGEIMSMHDDDAVVSPLRAKTQPIDPFAGNVVRQ